MKRDKETPDREHIARMLEELADRTAEPVRRSLADEIKRRIPSRLRAHKGLDTISIIVDLRINKVAAAAVIALAILLFATFYRAGNPSGNGLYTDVKMLLQSGGSGEMTRADMLSNSLNVCELLREKGKDVTYYGNCADPDNKHSILMHWKVADDKYAVIFSDFRMQQVSADVLILLQRIMLEERRK